MALSRSLDRLPWFAVLLRGYRRAAGLTQEELAEHAGLSARALRKLESGASLLPRRDTMALLAQALALAPADRDLLEASIIRQRRLISTTCKPTPPLPGAERPGPVYHLPTPLTPLIGREREEAAVVHLLREPDVRLLTLTGAPGIGKTRLALQVAANLCDDFADGVCFVDLTPVSDPRLALAAAARALGFRDHATLSLVELLTSFLRDKRILLVFDNFEHVLPAAPSLAKLLVACAGVRALVTSRAALRVRGEQELAVPPLAVPPNVTLLPSLEDLGQYGAVALLVQQEHIQAGRLSATKSRHGGAGSPVPPAEPALGRASTSLSCRRLTSGRYAHTRPTWLIWLLGDQR
jgi:transcriptional regulator with XRE-family HTH domain